MKMVVAPDSFKGSLSAAEAGDIIARAIRREIPEAELRVIPMADGGEGTVEALVAAQGGTMAALEARGPLGDRQPIAYGLIGGDETMPRTAVIEAAGVCGLTMVPRERRNPLHTTSAGMGEAIRHALDAGVRRIIVGLGGSATNDGGLGLLLALGAAAADAEDQPLTGGFGSELLRLASVDFGGLDPRLAECELVVACDVQNPLCGPSGATAVYGPQKGATPDMVQLLDAAMRRYASAVEAALGCAHSEAPGAGAAGGLGFALLALGAVMRPGAQVVEEATGLKAHLRGADWVFTGEGRSDGQTLFGKLPACVAQWAKEAGAKAILISGSFGEQIEPLYGAFDACFSVTVRPSTLEECLEQAEHNLYDCARNVARLIRSATQMH